jgi:hypothetical protein
MSLSATESASVTHNLPSDSGLSKTVGTRRARQACPVAQDKSADDCTPDLNPPPVRSKIAAGDDDAGGDHDHPPPPFLPASCYRSRSGNDRDIAALDEALEAQLVPCTDCHTPRRSEAKPR